MVAPMLLQARYSWKHLTSPTGYICRPSLKLQHLNPKVFSGSSTVKVTIQLLLYIHVGRKLREDIHVKRELCEDMHGCEISQHNSAKEQALQFPAKRAILNT
jgi:hypothetical protein